MNNQVDIGTAAGFLQTMRAFEDGKIKGTHEEPTDTELVLDKLADKAATLHRMPRKYLRALIAALDLRILTLGVYMSEAQDGISMAHNQGRLKEVTMLQEMFRMYLDRQLREGNE